jgi:hypothetical protein
VRSRARRDPRRHREAQNARSFAATSSASDLRGTPGAPSWTKLELEIGFGDFEHLAASPFAFSATFEICRDDTICRQGSCRNSGRQRDSLIVAKISKFRERPFLARVGASGMDSGISAVTTHA